MCKRPSHSNSKKTRKQNKKTKKMVRLQIQFVCDAHLFKILKAL